MERIAAIPLAEPEVLTADDAIRICRETTPAPISDPVFEEPLGIARDEHIFVRAADYGCDPISGVLVDSSRNEIVLRREDARAGVVTVHFPRVGYDVARAE